MSARSVLSAIDPEKYEVTMIGITKQGRWIGGDDPLLALESGAEAAGEAPVAALLGDPLNHALLQLREDERTREIACSNVAELDIVFPVLHGTLARTEPYRAFLSSPIWHMWAPEWWVPRSAWTKVFSRR